MFQNTCTLCHPGLCRSAVRDTLEGQCRILMQVYRGYQHSLDSPDLLVRCCDTGDSVQRGEEYEGGRAPEIDSERNEQLSPSSRKYCAKMCSRADEDTNSYSCDSVLCKDAPVSDVSRTAVAKKHSSVGRRHDFFCGSNLTHSSQALAVRYDRDRAPPQVPVQVLHPFARVSTTDIVSIAGHICQDRRSLRHKSCNGGATGRREPAALVCKDAEAVRLSTRTLTENGVPA
jgi:hypothetical protein